MRVDTGTFDDRTQATANAVAVGATVLLAVAGYVAALAYSDSLPVVQPAVPVLNAAAATAAAVATYLLVVRARATADDRCRWLGWGYGVAALALALQMLGFPGFLPGGGPLGTTSDGVFALYALWHLALVAFAAGAIWLDGRAGRLRPALGLAFAAAAVYCASGPVLPRFTAAGDTYSGSFEVTLAVLLVASLAVTLAWARLVGSRPTWGEAWITVSLALGSWDVLLYVLAEERFSAFWWASVSMRVAQFVVLAAGLLTVFVGLIRALERSQRSLAERLGRELALGHAAASALMAPDARRAEVARRIEAVLDDPTTMHTVFQPIAQLATGAVIGVEALTRFTASPQAPPNAWFEEAEAVGLGRHLELAAVRSALAHLDELPGDAFMSINVSPPTAACRELLGILDRVPVERVVIEITEHARVEDYGPLVDAVSELRGRGVRVAVDDAGAGFASLSHVARLKPDEIKLDLSLTRDIDSDPVRQALAGALISFSHEIGATIVAEGIEQRAELDALVRLGAERGQGYLLARPGPLSELPPYVRTGLAAVA